MQKVNNLKKNLSMFLAALMIFCMTSIQAFAQGNLAMLTMDATNFTIVGQEGEVYTIEAKGLSSSFAPVSIESGRVIWNSSNKDVVKIESVDKKTNTVKVKLNKKGEASVTATYDKDGVAPVSSNIVVEGESKGSVRNISVKIKDSNAPKVNPNNLDEIKNIVDVKIGELKLFNLDGKDVLKKNLSALHALIKALKNHDRSGELNVTTEGSFVQSMLGKECKYDFDTEKASGWQFVINGNLVEKSASICELQNGDEIQWFYGVVEGK